MHQYIRSAFASYGLNITTETADKFYKYYNMLIQANDRINLTAIIELDEVILKHFIDSCSPLTVNLFDAYGSCIDVGTGAGFPGIPLALMLPNYQFTLIDATRKKVDFLQQVIQALNLPNCTAMHMRAETLSHKQGYRESFDVAVSRAVSDIPALCEYCLPFVKTGGEMIAYRGNKNDEFDLQPLLPLGVTGSRIINPQISGMDHYLLCIEKGATTHIKFPRKQNAIYNRPLK